MSADLPATFPSIPPDWLASARAAMQQPARKTRLPLWVNGKAVGSLVDHFLLETGISGRLGGDSLLSKQERSGVAVWLLESPTQDATQLMNRLADALRAVGRSGPWRNEQLAVCAADGSRIGTVERGAVRVLGIATQAVHLVGVLPNGQLWVQQRAADKANYPLHWDTLMGGMVSAQDTLEQALERETWEEAGLRIADLLDVRWGGVLHFRQPDADGGDDLGFMHEDIHWYAATLPEGVVPQNQDGEVAQFAPWTADEVQRQLALAQFTPEAALVWAGYAGWM
ncbi:MAG: NUDIX domain-containing protein [Comamonas sp.]